MAREHMEVLLAGRVPASCPFRGRLQKTRHLPTAPPKYGAERCPFLCNWAWRMIAASIGLSEREVDVCRCLMRERCDKQIARDLGIAQRTVGRHIDRLYQKLSLHSRAAVVALVMHEHIKTLHRLPMANNHPATNFCGLRSRLELDKRVS
jgi:DNA-binding CsgD family transcriptional regulator